jgi:hypothetical protein
MQLEQIASGRIKLTEPRKEYLKQKFGLETAEQLDSVLHRVRTERSDKIILADQTNLYWTSYHGNFFLRDYQYLKAHTAWFIFEKHPLGKKSDYEYLKVLDSTRPNGEASYHFLPGNGNLNSEENQEKLKEQLMPFFSR